MNGVLRLFGLRMPGVVGILRGMGFMVGEVTAAELATIPCDVKRQGEERQIYAESGTASRKVRCERDAGSTWAWVEQGQVAQDARYVNVSGDTMTGTLDVNAILSANLVLIDPATGNAELAMRKMDASANQKYWSFQIADGRLVGYSISDDFGAANAWLNVFRSGVTVTSIGFQGPVVINDAGADSDFRVEGDTVASLLATDAGTDTVIIGGGTGIKKVLSATTTWDPGIVTGASPAQTTVTITGAAVGDPTFCGLSTLTTQALELHGAVSASDTVTATLSSADFDAAGIDLGSGTLRCVVVKF